MKFSKFTIIQNLFLSLKKGEGGYSGRKLSAVYCFLLAGFMVVQDKIPVTARLYALIALLITGAVCLGLVTIPDLIQILKSKNEKNENDEPK